MKNWFMVFAFLLAFVPGLRSIAQNKPQNVCYINNDRIYFQLDKRWSAKEKKEISNLFSLDSSLIEQAFLNHATFMYDSIVWNVEQIDNNLIELSKPLAGKQSAFHPNDVLLIDDGWFINPISIKQFFSSPKKIGFNKFAREPGVKYTDGIAHFLLTGYEKAANVYLSGSFNNWSTMQLPMQKTASGWESSLKLVPGRYEYKFIIDGKWIHDPNNLQKEDDGQAGYNSILYCCNYEFKLQGYTNAKKVILTGSFNGWQEKDLKMLRMPGGWSLPVYLEEGTHAYKFIVDGEWITDPANKITRLDADGNINSFMAIGDTLLFTLKGFLNAEKVILTGNFNGWSTNELLMNRTNTGWELPYVLAAGTYEYKFIVDGKWMADPANPVTTGSGDYVNSCVTFKPSYTFELSQFSDAKNVIVTGSFNGWSEDGYRMYKKDGVWICPVFLKPGKYTYKFIVDGKWLIDPANELWEENEYGTGNSVLWIEP